MKAGDRVRATWPDGLVLEGRYQATEQGYVILLDENYNKIVCNPHIVEFTVVSSSS